MAKKPGRVKGIYEREQGTGIWWIRFADPTGRIRREKAGARSAALKLYELRKTQILESRKLPSRKRPALFDDLVEDAIRHSEEHHSARWHDIVGWTLAPIKECFGGRTAESVTPQEIDGFLSERTHTPATWNRWRSIFSLVFHLGLISEKVDANPVAKVKRKTENNARERFLSDEEENKLRKIIRDQFPQQEPEFDLALHTGVRASELYGLDWADVDLVLGQMTIRKSKHGKKRHVQLNVSAQKALAALARAGGSTQGPVFPDAKRGQQRWFAEACQLAKVKNFRWHDLRHTFGSRLTMRGVDLRSVMQLMGHKVLATTLRYSHLSEPHLQEAVRHLDPPNTEGQTGTRTDTGPFSGDASSPGYVQ
jgi:integrase